MTEHLPPSDLSPAGLGTTLSLIARELVGAADALNGAQTALRHADFSGLPPSDMVRLQDLDRVQQTIRALSDIVARSAADPAVAALANAKDHLAGCSLSALAAVLGGQTVDPSPSIEFF